MQIHDNIHVLINLGSQMLLQFAKQCEEFNIHSGREKHCGLTGLETGIENQLGRDGFAGQRKIR